MDAHIYLLKVMCKALGTLLNLIPSQWYMEIGIEELALQSSLMSGYFSSHFMALDMNIYILALLEFSFPSSGCGTLFGSCGANWITSIHINVWICMSFQRYHDSLNHNLPHKISSYKRNYCNKFLWISHFFKITSST